MIHLETIADEWRKGFEERKNAKISRRAPFFERPANWGKNEIMRIVDERMYNFRPATVAAYLEQRDGKKRNFSGKSPVRAVVDLVLDPAFNLVSPSEKTKWLTELKFVYKHNVHWSYAAILIHCAGGYEQISKSQNPDLLPEFVSRLPPRVKRRSPKKKRY